MHPTNFQINTNLVQYHQLKTSQFTKKFHIYNYLVIFYPQKNTIFKFTVTEFQSCIFFRENSWNIVCWIKMQFFCLSTEFIERSSITYRSSEGKQNLSTDGVEEVRWRGDVADKPVDVMKLLHGKVVPKFLQGNKHTKL